MLNDWLWSSLFALCVWLEALAAAWLLGRRVHLSWTVRLAVSFAGLSQLYFAASLAGINTRVAHFAVIGMSLVIACAALVQNRGRLHLKLARHSWPWLALPCVWLIVRTIDALVPHNDWLPLAVNLDAAHRWFEQGKQTLDPLHPFTAVASLWEGLYFHIQVLTHALTPTHQTALVRGHIAAQLLHFTAGLVLAMLLLARLIEPAIKGSVKRSAATFPIAFALAWLACAQDPFAKIGVLARNDWGALMIVFAAAHLATQTRFAWAWFCFGTAYAMNQTIAATGVGLLALCLFSQIRRSDLFASVAGLALGMSTWLWRQSTQAGEGWFTNTALENLKTANAFAIQSLIVQILACLALVALVYFVLKMATQKSIHTFSRAPWHPIAVFTLTSLLASLVLSAPTLMRAVFFVFGSTLGTYFLLSFIVRRVSPKMTNSLPYIWLLLALVSVPIPFHVMWQHLFLANVATSSYLEQEVQHFVEKHWAAVHLPADKKIVWVDDSQFYYLTQPAASVSETNALREPLLHATNPRARTKILCDLGFNVLAWSDHHPRPELTGITSWLKVAEARVLYTSDQITFFELKCDEL